MTATHDSANVGRSRWLYGLKRMRLVLAAAAIAFAGLWALGAIAAGPALASFALIAGAVLVAIARAETIPAALPRDEPRAPHVGDPLIEAVLTGLPDPVVALDRRGDVVALNARARAVAPALRPGEAVSLGLRVPEVLDAIRRARASGTAQRVEFFERVPLDHWYEAIVTPILSAGLASNPGLVLLAFHDLTPLRRVEEMRADFVANASHELRTPLAALSGFIDTLKGPAREDPVERERFLGIMQVQAARMARLIDDLLSLSRIELNAHLRPDKQVDLGAMHQKSASYTAINPLMRVPALMLDDGTVITESIAICRYFEALQPDPPLFGRGALDIARVEMWNRRLEHNRHRVARALERQRQSAIGRDHSAGANTLQRVEDAPHRPAAQRGIAVKSRRDRAAGDGAKRKPATGSRIAEIERTGRFGKAADADAVDRPGPLAGPRDASAELVRAEFPDVRWLANEANLGFARAGATCCS